MPSQEGSPMLFPSTSCLTSADISRTSTRSLNCALSNANPKLGLFGLSPCLEGRRENVSSYHFFKQSRLLYLPECPRCEKKAVLKRGLP